MAIAHVKTVRAGELIYDALRFWCPGCDQLHQIRVSGPEPVWQWDGNIAAPTVSPSILVTQNTDPPRRCHSYFRAGAWDFLDDCTHGLRGRVEAVPLPEWLLT